MKTDLTVGAYIIHEGKLLLLKHRKLGLWLPPGGHIDPDETPDEATLREVKEETSLDVELMEYAPVPFGGHMERHCALPFYCNVHSVGDHLHYCMFFLCRMKGGDLKIHERESLASRWVGEEELHDSSIPEDVRNIALEAFKRSSGAIR